MDEVWQEPGQRSKWVMCHHTQLPWAQARQDYAALARHVSAGTLESETLRETKIGLQIILFYYFESPSSVRTLSLFPPLSLFPHLPVSLFFWPSLSLHSRRDNVILSGTRVISRPALDTYGSLRSVVELQVGIYYEGTFLH